MQNQASWKLEDVSIARPCRASWDAMSGSDQVRFCQSCHKNVYDVSSMTRVQGEALIQQHEGQLCLRLFRRADGTVITADCPVGTRQAQRPLRWLAAGLAALLAWGGVLSRQPQGVAGPTSNAGVAPESMLVDKLRGTRVGVALMEWLVPPPAPMQVLGDMGAPAPTPSTTPRPTLHEE